MPFAQAPRRRGRPSEDRYLCSGRDSPIRCGNCGGYFSIKASNPPGTYPDGETRRHYRCLRAGGGCGRTIADVRALDAVIEDLTLQRLSHPDQLATIRQIQAERLQAEHQSERRPHENEIARREALRPFWDKRLNDGMVTVDQYTAAVRDLNAGIREAQEALALLDAAPIPQLVDTMIAEIASGWNSATPATKRADLRRVWAGFQILVEPGSSGDTEEQVRMRISQPKRIPATPR